MLDSNLIDTRTEPGIVYLVETDPRYADYRTWLSSDFMLQQLSAWATASTNKSW